MGYNAVWGGSITIPKAKQEDCLAAINALHTEEAMRANGARGGSFGGGGKKTEVWYSWMNGVETPFATLVDAFDGWTLWDEFDHVVSDNGDLYMEGWHDSKIGNETVLLDAIAPFVLDTRIECTGEDGEVWLWEIKDGVFQSKPGRIIYDD